MDADFMELMVHTCTITCAGQSVATASSYGHKSKNFVSEPSVVYTDIRCRLRSLTAQEITSTGRDDSQVEDMLLYIPMELIPETMTARESPALHEVSDVTDLASDTIVNAGPFDVKSVRLIAGESHHYQVLLRKAGS